jgi:translation initiation factor 4E
MPPCFVSGHCTPICSHPTRLTLISSYRIAIWTKDAPDVALTEETSPLLKRVMDIGRHFKVSVLGFEVEQQLGGGYSTDCQFEAHSDSMDKKKSKTKLTV